MREAESAGTHLLNGNVLKDWLVVPKQRMKAMCRQSREAAQSLAARRDAWTLLAKSGATST
jgi:hypothetical protein